MKSKEKNIPICLILTAAVLLFLIVFINIVQSSLGRYTSFFGGEVTFSPNSKGAFQMNAGEWSVNEETGVQTLNVGLANGEDSNDVTQSTAVRVRVYVPDTNMTLPSLILNGDGVEYTASVTKIPEGTAAYKNYGEGQICCFYGTDGTELSFALPESATEFLDMTLILANEETDTTGFRVIVESVDTEKGR